MRIFGSVEEKSLVSWSILLALLLGATQSFLSVIPLAIFLKTYDSSLLTYAYIGGGILVYLLSILLRHFQNKYSFFKFLFFQISFFFLTVIFCWLLNIWVAWKWMPLIFFLWSALAVFYLNLIQSTLNINIFTLQEGKKYFGFISSARSLGTMLGGLIIPLIVLWMGTVYAFSVTIFSIFFSGVTLYMIKKLHEERFRGVRGENEGQISFRSLVNKKYVICLFLLTCCTIFISYAMDLLFNTEVKRYFVGEDKIAAFLGIFTALINAFSLAAGLFLYQITLKNLGLIATLFITPAALAVYCLVTIGSSVIFNDLGLVFTILCIAILLDRVARFSLNSGAVTLLFSPLTPLERNWAYSHYKTSVQSFSLAGVGLILLGISKKWGIHILTILPFILIVLAISFFVLWMIKQNYVKILIKAVEKWALVKPEFVKLDEKTLDLLKQRLKSPHPEEAIYVLETIEQVDREELADALIQSMESPQPDVRCYALKKIKQYQISSAAEKVGQMCLNEQDPKVIGSAYLTLGAIAQLDEYPWFRQNIQNPYALVVLSSRGDNEALKILNEKLNSQNPSLREEGAWILKKANLPDKVELLLPLLSDPSPEVRLQAVKAAATVQDKRLILPLIENLTVPAAHAAAVKCLLQEGSADDLIENFNRASPSAQVMLLRVLGEMKESAIFLQTFLNSEDRKLFQAAVHSLNRHGFQSSDTSILFREIQNILDLKPLIKSIQTEPLQGLLQREIELLQDICFDLLSFLYPKAPFISVREGLATGEKNKISFATEILLQTLTKQEAERLIPALTFKPAAQATGGPNEENLKKILVYSRKAIIPGINAATIYTIGVLGLTSLRQDVVENAAPHDPYLEEIRPWTLKKLGDVSK